MEKDGTKRPYRYAKTMAAMDKNNLPLIDPREMPPVQAYFEQFYGDTKTSVIGFIDENNKPDQTPILMAANLDVMALSLVEGSANETPQVSGQYSNGNTGAQILNNINVNYNQVNDSSGGHLQTLVESYGTPDKLLAALGGGETTLDDLNNYLVQVRETAVNLEYKGGLLKTQLNQLSGDIKILETLAESQTNAMTNIDEMFNGPLAQTLSRLDEIDARRVSLLSEIDLLGKEGSTLLKIRQELPAYKRLLTSAPKATQFLQGVNGFLQKIETPLNVLGFIGNTQESYNTAVNLGTYSPDDQDLKLSGSYDTPGGFAMDIGLNIMGIAGNAASGNVYGTVFDTYTFASGRFVDLYKTVQAAEHAEGQAKYAHKQHMLTMMRQTNQLSEIEADKLQELLDTEYGLYTDADPYKGGYDTSDPRIDKTTGKPKAAYWAYLKENSPQKLINLGIDPDAPVGGWPKRSEQSNTDWQKVNQSFSDAFEAKYPTAKPRNLEGNTPLTGAQLASILGELESDFVGETSELSAEQLREIYGESPEERRQRLKKELDDYQNGIFEQRKEDQAIKDAERADRIQAGKDNPITFEPVEWTSVFDEFEPVTMDPVTFTSVFDEVSSVFDETDTLATSIIDFTQFDGSEDDNWLGFANTMAYRYQDMSGTVETDLDPYEEFIAEYGLKRLERLALQAGYPNLASALNDWENLVSKASDSGFRAWAMRAPVCYMACVNIQGQWTQKMSQLGLGDLLKQSQDLFSTAGLTDVSIQSLLLTIFFRDFALEDGDAIRISVSQFGRDLFNSSFVLTNAGQSINVPLRPGVAAVEVTALNTGEFPPNTAAVTISNVTNGEDVQTYSLGEGEQGILRVNTGQN